MALAEDRLSHRIPREEIVLPVVRSSEGDALTMNPGDALNIEADDDGVTFIHRRHGVTYGRLDGYVLEGEWSAKVGDWEAIAVRLSPVDREPTGFDPSEIERCEKHGRPGCAWCAQDMAREGEQAVRLGAEDRRAIEEAQL